MPDAPYATSLPIRPELADAHVDGLIPTGHPLPPVAVDVTWRLTNHPGTLTAEWYDSVMAAGLQPGPYVEPIGGDPSPNVADDAELRAHWVPTSEVPDANVARALSMLPDENATRELLSTVHYLPPEALLGDLVSDQGSLSRVQVELVASRTSKLNECFS